MADRSNAKRRSGYPAGTGTGRARSGGAGGARDRRPAYAAGSQRSAKIYAYPGTTGNKRAARAGTGTDGRRRNGGRAAASYDSQNRAFQICSLLLIILFLLAFGLIMLYSTSSYEAGLAHDDSAYYLKRQLMNALIGIVAMFIMAMFDYRHWEKLAPLVYIVSILLILAIIPFGREVNGAKRWLYVGPVSVQPAEISKIAVILLTAKLINGRSPEDLKSLKTTLKIMVPVILQAGLLYYITRNLSSAIIVFLIGLGMLFVARTDVMRFVLLAVGGVGAVTFWVLYTVHVSNAGDTSDMGFRSERLLAWLDPQKYASGRGFQTLQALYGIGSGGMVGKGLGQSMQKLGYIPEAQNDMIFSIICEELGMFGAVSIIIMFIILCMCLLTIAFNAPDQFAGLTASGVMIHIAVQVILNIAVVTNTIPNTGVTLPFISYGGSSVIILLAEIGIVLNIARGNKPKKAHAAARRRDAGYLYES